MIIGSTSGIGRALAELCIEQGFRVGGVGRNNQALRQMHRAYPEHFVCQAADLRKISDLQTRLNALLRKMGGMDICVVSSGIARKNPDLHFDIENDVLQTNVTGYASVLIWAANYFKKQHTGHLVGITSLAKFLGSPNPAYTASKAFESRYLDGLRLKLNPHNIIVTEIMPGFVRTPMTRDQSKMFWAITPEKAAHNILNVIKKKKNRAVISLRWKPFYWLLPHIPYGILKRVVR